MLILLFILLVISDVLSQKQKLTVGIFLNDETMTFGMHRTGPLVDSGVRKLKNLVEEHVDVEIIRYISLHGSECDPDFTGFYGNIAAEMYYRRNVTAFIGPTCSVAAEFVGRMAAQWNLAIMSTSGSYEVLENKNIFKTLTRLTFNYRRIADFYMSILSHFNWTDISIIYERKGSRLYRALYEHNFGFANNLHTYLSAAGVSSTLIEFSSEGIDGYKKALMKGNKISRVFLLVCDNVALRGLMLKAHSMGMTNGDHVFLYFFYYQGYANGAIKWATGNEDDQLVRKAFESIFLIGEHQSQAKDYYDFQLEMKRQSLEQYNFSYFDQDINPFSLAYYEAFYIYGRVVKEMIVDGMDYTNGLDVTKRLWNRTFEDIHGKTTINSNGDRETVWMIQDLNPTTGNFSMVGYGDGVTPLKVTDPNVIHWPNGKGPPVNKPRCGFTGDAPECNIIYDDKLFMVLSLVLLVMILAFSAVGIVVYRKIKKENEIHSNWWKISWEDISWLSHCYSRYSHLCLSEAKLRLSSDGMSIKTPIQDKKMATFKGSKVYLYKFAKNQMPTTRLFYMELSQLRSISCPHLTKFFGLTKNESNIFAVIEFCTRGDLRDILSNDSFVLNRDFSISLIRDIIQAMEYIHSSNIRYHGSLHSRNCVIDSRFVLKVTNIGLQSLREFKTDCQNENCLWIAPELLRKSTITLDCLEMQCADVYSFGIIMYEVLSRKEPFEDDKEILTLREIVSKLMTVEESLFRPQLNAAELDKDVINMMKQCWGEDPKERPSFQALRKESRNLQWDRSGDQLLDNLLSRMEEYANNLEDLIEQRTQSLIEEKKRSEELLYQVLPKSVANKLKSGYVVDPEAYTCVTIYFSDIVGFTRLSSESTPMQVIDLLNELYICFDKIIENFDVYKVETIGDAYMVVSGLPTRNGDQHVVEIAKMSCSILESLKTFKIKHMPDQCLHARIGLHSGPVCAGVVGRKMPRYCLFGDTVNTASRMESNGEPMKIHVSENTRNLLQNHPDFLLEERGEIRIKGKGLMRTFWLQYAGC